MSDYYDPDGNPISQEVWCRLYETRKIPPDADQSWWRTYSNVTVDGEDVRVSTVWLGLNHQWDPELPPLFWETMIFGGEHDNDQWRYSSKESALADHQRIVEALKSGQDPWEGSE